MSEPLNPYQLANLADVTSPDGPESPGALWLLRVARSAAEIIEEGAADDRDIPDEISSSADQLVPIYTHEKWTVFVDLCAYTEDVSDLGTPDDMDAASNWALYMIAERLLSALVEAAGEDDDEEGDE